MENSKQLIKSGEKPEVTTISLGGEIDRVTVSLRFFGDDLEPNEITELLKCQPTDAKRKGEIIQSQSVKYPQRIVKTGSWILSDETRVDRNLEELISEKLKQLPEDLEIWRHLAKRFDADIFCGAWLEGWNRHIWFTPNMLKQIADRNLRLRISVYCDSDDDE